VLNCLQISTFGGSPDGFYDGAHLTAGNSRRLIRYCIRMAPSCFRVPKPTPSPSPSPIPSPSASPIGLAIPAPAYTPVPEVTSIPADVLE
jgi:hypothetical protein